MQLEKAKNERKIFLNLFNLFCLQKHIEKERKKEREIEGPFF